MPLIITTPDFDVLRHGGVALRRHVVVAGSVSPSTAAIGFDRLSLRTVRRGAELLKLGARRLRLDEDAYIAVNGGADCAGTYVGDSGVSLLLVAFRPGSLAQSLAEAEAEAEAEAGESPAARAGFEFLETLQPHGGAVTRHLQSIEHRLRDGEPDPMWWEERIALLLTAAIDAECASQRRESLMAALKPATRRELLRRVLMASDYIQSNYEQAITLHDIAAAAHLSRFHLVRLFQRAHGLTPHAYLTQKRVTLALRLIARTQLGLDDIAARAGLGTRSSLFRHLRRQRGSGASALRASTIEQGSCATSA